MAEPLLWIARHKHLRRAAVKRMAVSPQARAERIRDHADDQTALTWDTPNTPRANCAPCRASGSSARPVGDSSRRAARPCTTPRTGYSGVRDACDGIRTCGPYDDAKPGECSNCFQHARAHTSMSVPLTVSVTGNAATCARGADQIKGVTSRPAKPKRSLFDD